MKKKLAGLINKLILIISFAHSSSILGIMICGFTQKSGLALSQPKPKQNLQG
jgi:hypothetical protein